MEAVWFLAGLVAGIVLTNLLMLVLRIFSPWLRCFLSGAPISMVSLVGMYLRGSPTTLLIDTHIGLTQSGTRRDGKVVTYRIHEIEAKYLSSPGRYLTAQELMQAMKEDPEKGRVEAV
jgi:hypothetical protein